MSFLFILTLIFVVAKLFGFVAWSWFIVFIPAAIQIVIAIFAFLCVVLAEIGKAIKS